MKVLTLSDTEQAFLLSIRKILLNAPELRENLIAFLCALADFAGVDISSHVENLNRSDY
jgi:hypothetical protein